LGSLPPESLYCLAVLSRLWNTA